MKFAFCLFKYFPHGGLERDFIRITQACQQRGHTIEVFTNKWQGEKLQNLKVTLIPAQGWSNHRRVANFVRNLFNSISRQEYDAIVGFNRMPGLDIYYAADLSYAAKAKQHNLLYKLSSRYRTYMALEAAIFAPNSTTQILYLAESLKQQYIDYYGTQKERFHLLGPGIDKPKAIAKTSTNSKDNLILLVGSNFKLKGVDRALLAHAALPEELRQNSKLLIVGKGKIKQFSKLAKKLGIAEQVEFLGLSDRVAELYQEADILIHPARYEAAGLVIVEAIATGLPVLTTASCGYSYHVTKSNAGLVMPSPFSQDQLNSALQQMLDATAQKSWRRNAQEYAKKEELYGRVAAAEIIEKIALKAKA